MRALLGDIKLVLAVIFLILMTFAGIFSSEIAKSNGLIAFGPHEMSSEAVRYSPPGTMEISPDGNMRKHHLGTDQIGRDVASRLIHGISIALKVGVLSSMIALLISLILGGLAGFFGDKTQKMSYLQLAVSVLSLILGHHFASEYGYSEAADGLYKFYLLRYVLVFGIFLVMTFLLVRWLGRIKVKSFWIPWDILVVKLIEIFNSVPKLFLLLAIFAVISRPSVWSVIVVIGIIRWPTLTRIIRAEILAIKQEDYIKNAQLLGLPPVSVFFKHILPNIYKSIIVITAINMGSAILIESSLSFLHIGLPQGEVSWGGMIEDARHYFSAWWMAVAPGIMIFSMILCFNVIGDRLSYHFKVEKINY